MIRPGPAAAMNVGVTPTDEPAEIRGARVKTELSVYRGSHATS